jgi:NADH-quinone oxidoreductase subunit G
MTDVAANTETIQVTLNGATVHANKGELLIDACERSGVYIPRFCYHPRMTPVGMCRMCLVEVDAGRGPALAASCMIECTPDMVIDTESDLTKKAQDGVLEFLLINHPLDCPICDKGGECPLQDNTMAFGPGESRFDITDKRHYEKPIPISDTVYLDRERCILCDRCTRFADEVAGDPLIHFMDRGNATQVNTFPDEPFSSYFSGNTVQICPVGALTAKPYRFRARPWDLQRIESTATIDSVGSRIEVHSSRNEILRYQGVDSDTVNWGWLSDKERFSFEALNSEARVSDPLVRGNGLGTADPSGSELVATTWATAYATVANAIKATSPERIGVIGGARLPNEAQYAWSMLAKSVIGTDNVDAQLGDGLPAEVVLSLPRATINDACTPGGTVVLLSADPKEELGAFYLRLRHAVIEDGVTLIELTPRSTGLSHLAKHSLHARPGEVGALAAALAAGNVVESVAGVTASDINAAAGALGAGQVTVVLGRASLAESAGPTVDAAYALADGVTGAKFLSALRRGNIHGALDMGMAPGLAPGRVAAEGARGMDTAAMLEAAAAGDIDVLILLGADPISDFPDHDLAARALKAAGMVVAVDLFVTASAAEADVVLAAAGPNETDGTFTNLEGRISLIQQKVTAPGTARADWIMAAELALVLGTDLGFGSLGEVWDQLSTASAMHSGISLDALHASSLEGVVVMGQLAVERPAATPIPSVDAYSLRLTASRSMYDQGAVLAQCKSSAHLAPGTKLSLNPHDFGRLGIDQGASVRVESNNGSLEVTVVADTGVPRGSAAMLVLQPNARVFDLVSHSAPVTDVRVERSA